MALLGHHHPPSLSIAEMRAVAYCLLCAFSSFIVSHGGLFKGRLGDNYFGNIALVSPKLEDFNEDSWCPSESLPSLRSSLALCSMEPRLTVLQGFLQPITLTFPGLFPSGCALCPYQTDLLLMTPLPLPEVALSPFSPLQVFLSTPATPRLKPFPPS